MKRKLIEQAFPLKKVSEDSKHEKNVRHGHISTLHIWPARRPLAACRAVTIAALLDDPADADPEIQAEYRRLTGSDDPDVQREKLCEMIGSITRWKTENGPNLKTFKDLIRKTYHGEAPKVLDPFSGGGAIPLEAMRLGCAVTANDYNPVAWFILKCTLEYPQRFAGKTLPLPDLDLPNELQVRKFKDQQGTLADHVELWGRMVFNEVRKEIGHLYPVIDGQPTVAYLWARTVPCQDPNCGATVPLLKTLWLCNKKGKLRALRMKPDQTTRQVAFEIYKPQDAKDVGEPTMAKAKSTCPVCGTLLTRDYLKQCGFDSTLRHKMTCVVYDTPNGKEYRPPTPEELAVFKAVPPLLEQVALDVPGGLPNEPLPGSEILGMRVPLYGFTTWAGLFTERQLLAIMTFVKHTHRARQAMQAQGYDTEWIEAVAAYLAVVIDKLADYNSMICTWHNSRELIGHTFARNALPITWDFSEIDVFSLLTGGFLPQLDWVLRYIQNLVIENQYAPSVINSSATTLNTIHDLDAVITDPPYYDAIPYADLADFFYVWLKRTVGNTLMDAPFSHELTPKSEELVAHSASIDADSSSSRLTKSGYEAGMTRTFQQVYPHVVADGRFVVVFANKQPDAWETLISAMINSGFVITASLPIDTEMTNRTRGMGSAALSSSVWIVCRKRPANAGIGRYKTVMQQMQERITERLRYFWDQGIHGPDFVWSALGPALEAYSRYEQVKRLDGSLFTVSEFLREVRRLVTDFALGRILHQQSTEGLDAWTAYYLMHRYDFGAGPAPAGECILLAQGYMLDLDELRNTRGMLKKAKGGNEYALRRFDERDHADLGEPHPSGGLPAIDMLHKLMQLWKSGNTQQRDAYTADHGLMDHDLFWAMAQAVLETCDPKTDAQERSLLEALISWGRGKTIVATTPQAQTDMSALWTT